jgi:hypothetical protein
MYVAVMNAFRVNANLNKTAMYVQRNIEARSCNHYCSAKAKSITQTECVFVALGIQHAHAPYCHLWRAPLYNVFLHFLIKGTIFEKRY